MIVNVPYIGDEIFVYAVAFILLFASFIFRNIFLYLALFVSLFGVLFLDDINSWVRMSTAILMIYSAVKIVHITWTALDRG